MNRFLTSLSLLLFGALFSPTLAYAALTMDAEGWTIVTPSADSRVVYVSSSEGNDSNNGLSPQTPKKTILAGEKLLRDNHPDHLLLKRGDVFEIEAGNLLGRWKNGRNAQEPMLLSYYGDSGARPVVKVQGTALQHAGKRRDYQALIGIDFYREIADPNSPLFPAPDSPDFEKVSGGSIISLVGGGKNFLMEDCRLRYGSVVIQSFGEGSPYSDARFRRNIILDSWGHDSYLKKAGPQGIYMEGIKGSYVIEENFIDHCGWSEQVPNAGANMYNHNIYIQYSTVAGGIIRGNIISRGAAHGIQARSGGLVDRNLFILNAISLNMGGVSSPTDPNVFTFPNRMKENVVISGRRMDPNNGSVPRTPAVWGIDSNDLIPGALVEDNIVANRIHSGSNSSYLTTGNPVMVNNISYKWANDTPVDPTWAHPDDDMGDYFESIGGENDTIAYLEWLRERPLRTMPWGMTAYAGINYIREGFNREPVGGYFIYDELPETVAVTGVALDAETLTLDVSEVTGLIATVTPASATNSNVTWTSSNKAVATVGANGQITAVGAGSTTITVTTVNGGFTDTVSVTVEAPVVAVTGVSLNVDALTLEIGETAQFTATVAPANAANGSLTWQSSNEGVATVSQAGLITAVADGSSTITVTTVDGSFTDTVAVTVEAPIIGQTDTWAGYPMDEEGNVNTGAFLGWILVQGDWLFVWDREAYIYLPEDWVDEFGAWTFILR